MARDEHTRLANEEERIAIRAALLSFADWIEAAPQAGRDSRWADAEFEDAGWVRELVQRIDRVSVRVTKEAKELPDADDTHGGMFEWEKS